MAKPNQTTTRHLTGPVEQDYQRCDRCGCVITPPGLAPFEVGIEVVRVFVDGARGIILATAAEIRDVPPCRLPH